MVLTAIFQAQSGWSRDLVRGQHAVAHWIRPIAFSMALADMGDPLGSSSRSSMTLMCLGAAIWTRGMVGWITNPSQVLISTVFFQLRGVPNATSVPKRAAVNCGPVGRRSSQQKSSTKTKPVDLGEEVIEDP